MRTMKRYLLFNARRGIGECSNMYIEIDISVANDSDAHQWLDHIVYTIMDGWHRWATTNHENSAELRATSDQREGNCVFR